ncbi:MAG: hypothetical protein Fur0012_11100 [Elusimicrobiota bacterium]
MLLKKIKDKHLLPSAFTAKDFMGKYHKGFKSPPTVIFLFHEKFFYEAVEKYSASRQSYRGLYKISEKLALQLSPVGAAAACSTAEDLFAADAERIIIFGFAGAINENLDVGNLVLCDMALKDEGVSRKYSPEGEDFSFPSACLKEEIASMLKNNKISFRHGPTWTTEAPYRETCEEIKLYSRQGVLTVEMEASALFSMASYHKKDAAALFTVSDILSGNKKGFGFHFKRLKENYIKTLLLLCEKYK